MSRSLRSLNTPNKISISFFLLSIIIGTISALIMLGLLLSEADSGLNLPSVEKIKLKYHYPELVAAMKTTMYEYVADDADIEVVANWISNGSSEEVFEQSIKPIMRRDCTSCHNPTSTMSDAMPGMPLTTYAEVTKHTKAGYSWVKMAKQAHVHLFGIGTFLIIVTTIFAFTSFPSWIRSTLITITWTALLIDVLCWWITKYYLIFAYLIVGAGSAMSGGIIAMAGLALLDCWIVIPFLSKKTQAVATDSDA
ncbi:MAG: hypothetical protein PF961_18965 [Planctomycetota bacterium]|jgi:hypothetical protein|nr:hypothetical protein [Planctomycetota bacterium]